VEGRFKNREDLWNEINAITSEISTQDLVEKMNAVGIPCGPINNIGEAFNDDQVKFLKMTKRAMHSQVGSFNIIRSPITLSNFEHDIDFDRPGPELGEHSEEILRELNYSDEAIAELKDSGVVKSSSLNL